MLIFWHGISKQAMQKDCWRRESKGENLLLTHLLIFCLFEICFNYLKFVIISLKMQFKRIGLEAERQYRDHSPIKENIGSLSARYLSICKTRSQGRHLGQRSFFAGNPSKWDKKLEGLRLMTTAELGINIIFVAIYHLHILVTCVLGSKRGKSIEKYNDIGKDAHKTYFLHFQSGPGCVTTSTFYQQTHQFQQAHQSNLSTGFNRFNTFTVMQLPSFTT